MEPPRRDARSFLGLHAGYGSVKPPIPFDFQHHILQGSVEETATGGKPLLLRRRWNCQALLLCVLMPWGIFACVFAAASFQLPGNVLLGSSGMCFLTCVAALLVVIPFGVMAAVFWRKEEWYGTQRLTWFSFLFATGLMAWFLGIFLGWINYQINLAEYYFISNLKIYDSLDPVSAKGQQLMDAGRVTFVPGSQLDLHKSFGFRHGDMYCVAPVSRSDNKQSNYDFWAVGTNCCNDHLNDFRCGDYTSKLARSGVRLLDDSQRPWFHLAVQQAEAAHGIHSEHPIFLTWMEDPNRGIDEGLLAGLQWYFTGVVVHLLLQTLSVVGAIVFLLAKGW